MLQLLVRFGNDVTMQHEDLLNALLVLLKHPHESVRKRSSITFGPLVVSRRRIVKNNSVPV
jgi:hypothetical protein